MLEWFASWYNLIQFASWYLIQFAPWYIINIFFSHPQQALPKYMAYGNVYTTTNLDLIFHKTLNDKTLFDTIRAGASYPWPSTGKVRFLGPVVVSATFFSAQCYGHPLFLLIIFKQTLHCQSLTNSVYRLSA